MVYELVPLRLTNPREANPPSSPSIVGLFNISATLPDAAFQFGFTFTCAPAAMPLNLDFSVSVKAFVFALLSYNVLTCAAVISWLTSPDKTHLVSLESHIYLTTSEPLPGSTNA